MDDNISSTFMAALRSVLTATSTMAAAGFYLHRRKFITAGEKKGLARMSQQVTIPALFFTKIIDCPQNFSTDKCPSVTDTLADVWVLMLWPLYVVGCGLVVGEAAARLSSTLQSQRSSVLAACAFANSTGLPITLLTVIHSHFPDSTEIGRIDPSLFLSVYLILYPVMQWGIGGWLLEPVEDSGAREWGGTQPSFGSQACEEGLSKVETAPEARRRSGNRLLLCSHERQKSLTEAGTAGHVMREMSPLDLLEVERRQSFGLEIVPLVPQTAGEPDAVAHLNPPWDMGKVKETVLQSLPKAFQPPVIGALLGLLVASFDPLRGIFVDLNGRANRAPLEWLYDGLCSVRS